MINFKSTISCVKIFIDISNISIKSKYRYISDYWYFHHYSHIGTTSRYYYGVSWVSFKEGYYVYISRIIIIIVYLIWDIIIIFYIYNVLIISNVITRSNIQWNKKTHMGWEYAIYNGTLRYNYNIICNNLLSSLNLRIPYIYKELFVHPT